MASYKIDPNNKPNIISIEEHVTKIDGYLTVGI